VRRPFLPRGCRHDAHFTEVEGLFIPGFFLATAGRGVLMAVTLAYLAELFPTEDQGHAHPVVLSCQVAAGSSGS